LNNINDNGNICNLWRRVIRGCRRAATRNTAHVCAFRCLLGRSADDWSVCITLDCLSQTYTLYEKVSKSSSVLCRRVTDVSAKCHVRCDDL